METKPLSGRFQHLVLVLILLFCFGGVFYTYYKPTISLLSCPNFPVSKHEVCTEECLSAVKENLTQSANTTDKLDDTLLKQKLTVVENNEENQNQDIIMLIWSWPFGFKFDVKGCSSQFGIKGCQIIDDRSQYDKAHGVMFHHRDIRGDLPNLLKMPRPPHQKWVWMNMESPDNSGKRDEADNLFNLTSNYRRDSDVWAPYGRILEASEEDKPFKIPQKDKLVCWIVSNWNPNFRRVKYFSELSKHIKVEAYGRHFSRYVSDEDYNKILSSCKFYLSFENSIHKDYFTEKLFNPLRYGTVPVVLGPSRENYEEYIPAESFIHVDDFKSPQELAEYLTLLDQNQEMYERHFVWRQYFTAVGGMFGLEHACLSCDYIRNYKGYRVFKNLNKWYWG